MPILQIRDLPEPVYLKLKQAAARERRSIARQATVLLEAALAAPNDQAERRRRLLEEFAAHPVIKRGKRLPAPEALIREDRER